MRYVKLVTCMCVIRKMWHFLGVPISSAIERFSPRGVEGHSEGYDDLQMFGFSCR